MVSKLQAFLSHTRPDDEAYNGAITALSQRLELRVREITGDRGFTIFQDIDGIEFGQHWPSRLDDKLASVPVLIPMLSPLFFRSEPCRAELAKFLELERRAGRRDLILAIYFVTAPVLERPGLRALDPLAEAMHKRQWRDWRSYADIPLDHEKYGRAVDDLAVAIAAMKEQTASQAALKESGKKSLGVSTDPARSSTQNGPIEQIGSEDYSEITNTAHLVILVHGIRTRAKWYRVIKPLLEQHGFKVEPTNYGRFDLIRFLVPGRRFRRGVVDKVRRQIDRAKNRHPDIRRPSYIAHSFGTYIISNILDNEISFEADRIIFCGSVVSVDFKFDRVKAQFTPDILNDIGTRDYWPALAESVTSGYGSTGTYGFSQAYVRDRWHNGIGHSDFLTKEFCEKFWVDFLKSGTIRPGDTDIEDAPWWTRPLPILVSKWIFIPTIILFLIIYGGASYCGTSGSWLASGLHGGADFGGTFNDKHFADYHEELSAINVQIDVENCDRIASGSSNTLGTEQLRDINLLLDPRFRPIPPNVLSFDFLGLQRKAEKFSIDFKGSNANAPKSSAHFDGEFVNRCPLPWFVAKFFSGCIKFHGDLSIFRTDAESPLSWQVTVPVTMSR